MAIGAKTNEIKIEEDKDFIIKSPLKLPSKRERTASTCQDTGLIDIKVCSQPGMVTGSAYIFDMKTNGIKIIQLADITADRLLITKAIITKNQDKLSEKIIASATDTAI